MTKHTKITKQTKSFGAGLSANLSHFNHFVCFVISVCFVFSFSSRAQIKPVVTTMPGTNVDSLAIWIAPNKTDSLVFLTEKSGGQVMVFKADAQATFVRRFGQFKRPNGIGILQNARIGAVRKDLAFITDRDDNRVSIYSIPDFSLLGTFGTDLVQPMGIALYQRPRDKAVFAYIVQKRATADDKVVRYRLTEAEGQLSAERELQFGREVSVGQETVAVDAARQHVLVADENERDIKVYNLDGKLQRSFGKGAFEAQVEGIVLAACGKGGYIVASDQKDITEFEFFDRITYKHLGTVKGTAAHTDGIALTLAKLPSFPNGLFTAQSDPASTGGLHAEFYDFGAMLKTLRLNARACFKAQ
jgi:3-phytase